MFLGQVLPTSGPQHPASAVGSSRHRTEAGGMGLDGRVLAFMGKGRKQGLPEVEDMRYLIP